MPSKNRSVTKRKPPRQPTEPANPQTGIQYQRAQISYSGPLPHPQLLHDYDLVVENGAERIFATFEKQADHRMHLEKMVIEHDLKTARLGLWLGFVVALAMIAGSVFLALTGHEALGGGLGGTTIVALASAFIYSNHRRKNERIEKAKLMTGQK